MKVMALGHREIDIVYTINTFLFLGVVIWVMWLVKSFAWPREVAWAVGLMMVMPSSGLKIVLFGLRRIYGYADGVGGATKWSALDTAALSISMLNFVLYGVYVNCVPMPPLSGFAPDFLVRLLAIGVVNVILLGWVLRLAWRDVQDWQKVAEHGIFMWDFKTFVWERFAVVESGATPNF